MRRRARACAGFGVLLSFCAAPLHALTIYEIQHTTTDGDASAYAGGHQDVAGGIVVHKWMGGYGRVYLQDPAYPTWGGICVKDWEGVFYNDVEIGDEVSVDNIYVEEFRGNTYLQYSYDYSPDVTYSIVSTGNPIPDPALLTLADMPYPLDHAASEPYESMIARVEYVTVGAKGLGKADDNYELHRDGQVGWAADYMNIDKPSSADYDPRIETGVLLESVSGVFEQYTDLQNGWDYYQLCTRSAADIAVAPAIPTVSEWGVAVMTLLAISTGSVLFKRVPTCRC